MALVRKLLGVYAAIAVGIAVVTLVGWVSGVDRDLQSAALLFGAGAIGGTCGTVFRRRGTKAH